MQFRRQSLNLNTILYQCRVIVLLQQPLDVRLPVQDLPAKLDIGNPSLVPVILQAPAADLQHPGVVLFIGKDTSFLDYKAVSL